MNESKGINLESATAYESLLAAVMPRLHLG